MKKHKGFTLPEALKLHLDKCRKSYNDISVKETLIQFYLLKEHTKKMMQCEQLKKWAEQNGTFYAQHTAFLVDVADLRDAIDAIFRGE